MHNDDQIIKKLFKKGKQYFSLRNYKYETIFHVAAKHNSLQSLKEIVQNSIFVEELLKKDYKGDTPIHIAARRGHIEILEFFITAVTPGFVEIKNDLGLTPVEAVEEKIKFLLNKDNETDLSQFQRSKI